MGSSSYTLIHEDTQVQVIPPLRTRIEDMRYLNRLSYAGPSTLPESNPASDSLIVPSSSSCAITSSSPPKYTTVMYDDGYRVGQGGMVPKGGIYWSPPNSPKTAELQQQRQQQHKTWKLDPSSPFNASSPGRSNSPEIQEGNATCGDEKPKRRRLRKLLRKLSTGSSSEE